MDRDLIVRLERVEAESGAATFTGTEERPGGSALAT
jgi:hypothetical protein